MPTKNMILLFIIITVSQSHLVFATSEEGNGRNFPHPKAPNGLSHEAFFVSQLGMSLAETFADDQIDEAAYSKAITLQSHRLFLSFQKELQTDKDEQSVLSKDAIYRNENWKETFRGGLLDFFSKNSNTMLY